MASYSRASRFWGYTATLLGRVSNRPGLAAVLTTNPRRANLLGLLALDAGIVTLAMDALAA
jgi:hypothetical protein